MPFDAPAATVVELESPPPAAQAPAPEPTPALPPAPHIARNLPPPAIAAGEKAKARDLLAALRTLKAIEAQKRPATDEEQHILARFPGFGALALSIFPDPVRGGYKDSGWWKLGQELKELLTPQEYDSAKRTTFNQYFTSPVVMQAMYDGLGRLGVPADALTLEPGCGVGNRSWAAKPCPSPTAALP